MTFQNAASAWGLALACVLLSQPGHAAETYDCTVQDFIGFDREDTTFIAANKRKTFQIRRDGQRLTVIMESEDFDGTTDTFSVYAQTFGELVAFEDGSNGTTRLVMPLKPENAITRQGYFNTTISLQYDFIANSWLLRCEG